MSSAEEENRKLYSLTRGENHPDMFLGPARVLKQMGKNLEHYIHYQITLL